MEYYLVINPVDRQSPKDLLLILISIDRQAAELLNEFLG
jgi:hypothetical protein